MRWCGLAAPQSLRGCCGSTCSRRPDRQRSGAGFAAPAMQPAHRPAFGGRWQRTGAGGGGDTPGQSGRRRCSDVVPVAWAWRTMGSTSARHPRRLGRDLAPVPRTSANALCAGIMVEPRNPDAITALSTNATRAARCELAFYAAPGPRKGEKDGNSDPSPSVWGSSGRGRGRKPVMAPPLTTSCSPCRLPTATLTAMHTNPAYGLA